MARIVGISIKNFKSIGEEPVEIEFRPITMLFGPNSAGKSSIVQAIHLFRDVVLHHNCSPNKTESGGDSVDLGGFQQFVHQHDLSRRVQIGLLLQPEGGDFREVNYFEDDPPGPEDLQEYALTPESLLDAPSKMRVTIELAVRPGGAYVASYAVDFDGEEIARLDYTPGEKTPRASIAWRHKAFSWINAFKLEINNLTSIMTWKRESLISYFKICGQLFAMELAKQILDERPRERRFAEFVLQQTEAISRDRWLNEKLAHWNELPNLPGNVTWYEAFEADVRHCLDDGMDEKDYIPKSVPSPQDVAGISEPEFARFGITELFTNFFKPLSDWQLITRLRPKQGNWPGVSPAHSILLCALEHRLLRNLEVVTSGHGTFQWVQQPDALPQSLQLPNDGYWEEFAGVQHQSNWCIGHWLRTMLEWTITQPLRIAREALDGFRYLGPLREIPPRDFTPTPATAKDWPSGLGAWAELEHSEPDELVRDVSEWIASPERLDAGCGIRIKTIHEIENLGGEIDVAKLADDLKAGRIPLKRKLVLNPRDKPHIKLRPHDLGVGISQLIPVIVTVLRNKSLCAIEQPELHVHPRLQVRLGELLIEYCTDGKACLIETHSEHLVLRLLRRIRDTESGKAPTNRQLRTDGVAIYYLKTENGAMRANRINVDVNGDFIEPWPDDFFEIDFYERFPDAR